MSDADLTRRASLNEASINDVRWRLESAMEKLDGGLVVTALDLIVEAGEVVEAMLERWRADQRREARLARGDS